MSKKKYCPLSAITSSNPTECNKACAWCVTPFIGEPHCALLHLAAIPEIVDKIPAALNPIGAAIEKKG